MKLEAKSQAPTAGWRAVERNGGVVLAVLLAAAGLGLGDKEALALAAVVGVGLVLLWLGREVIAGVVLALLSANSALWMIPGAVSNLRHGEGAVATLVPTAIALASVVTLTGALGALLRRRNPAAGKRVGRPIGAVAVALFAVVALVNVVQSTDTAVARPGEVRLVTENVAFSSTVLEAPAGTVSVRVRNGDLFWHTFTVPDLGVDVRVPVRATRGATFDAPAGSYEFFCAIPGHPQAGMKGVLTVR